MPRSSLEGRPQEAVKMFNVDDTWFKKDEKKFRIELKSKIVEI